MSTASLTSSIDGVVEMIRELSGENPHLPYSYLFNEGWMLRLILKAAEHESIGHQIPKIESSRHWTSEARLYTPFDESRGDAYEGFTSADAIVGEFTWDTGTKAGVRLENSATRFEIFEAKMFSKLSKGVKAADWYDQAVRNVACMAQTLARSGIKPCNAALTRVGFWVIAPQSQLDRGLFSTEMAAASMRGKIQRRIGQFTGQGLEELVLWRDEYFEPLLQRLDNENSMGCLSWETLIRQVQTIDRRDALDAFYKKCRRTAQAEHPLAGTGGPFRGGRYRIEGAPGDERVLVCFAGDETSRVFVPGSNQASFTVKNSRLVDVNDGQPGVSLPIPKEGEYGIHAGRRVQIVSSGPCRSRVTYADSPGPTALVDNHLLQLDRQETQIP